MTAFPPNSHAQRRNWLTTITALALAAVCAPLVVRGPALVLWNASASVPVGLYLVQPNAPLHAGDLAVSSLPPDARDMAADRRYLPRGVLLIKPVAAEGGSVICRRGAAVYVDGVHAGDAQPFDRRRRPMPVWQGCRLLSPSEIFLMNPTVPDSFDGRYFGPIALSLAKGRAFPLLTFAQHPRT